MGFIILCISRNADDQKRVDDLKQLAADLNIVEHIEFRFGSFITLF